MEGNFMSVIAAFLIIMLVAALGFLLGMGTPTDCSECEGTRNKR